MRNTSGPCRQCQREGIDPPADGEMAMVTRPDYAADVDEYGTLPILRGREYICDMHAGEAMRVERAGPCPPR